MNLTHPRKPIRVAALLILFGLIIEGLSFIGVGPMAFMSFLFGGGLLMGSGVLLYLASLALGWIGDQGG